MNERDKKAHEKKAQRKTEVRRSAADPEVYETRLGYQGGRGMSKRIQASITNPGTRTRWVQVRGKWQRMDVRNVVHRATATVHDGTIKGLTTESLPETPSLSWWYKVDTNVDKDQRRKEGRDKAFIGAMTAAVIIEERNRLPAKRAHGGTQNAPFDTALQDAREAHQSPTEHSRPKAAPKRGDAKNPVSDPWEKEWREKQARDRETKRIERIAGRSEPDEQPLRYLPPISDPGPRFGLDEDDYEEDDPRVVAARREQAAEDIEALSKRAGVDSKTFALLKQYLAFGATLRTLGRQEGSNHTQIRRLLGPAIDKLTAESKKGPADLVDRFKKAYTKRS